MQIAPEGWRVVYPLSLIDFRDLKRLLDTPVI